jgi:hypothetical protein
MVCTGGVCAPTADSATLNVNDLETLLASGNVEVTTTGSGVQANNIVHGANLSWSGPATLTLDAHQSITIDTAIAVAGTGGLNLRTNDGGSGGALLFGPAGNITFQTLSSPLAINGNSYTLVNSIAALAQTGGNGFIALAQSYDASGDGVYAASPVQNLSGTFEGLGNTISNLTITDSGPDYVGLFSGIATTGNVRDFALSNVTITSIDQANLGVGALAGESAGQIFGVWSSGAVTSARSPVGGLAGSTNGGTITNSYSTAAISAGVDGGGGLVGEAVRTTIDNCYAAGEVSNTTATWIGGLLGSSERARIEYSFASGTVRGLGGSEGGSEAGGLIGITLDNPRVISSYATGDVVGGTFSDVGGLIGYVVYGGKFGKSYSTGSVSGNRGSLVGGFVGGIGESRYPVTFQQDYWDTDTSGASEGTGNEGNVTGLTGLTSAQFQAKLPKGLSKKYWAENPDINSGFPYLLANPPPE